MESIQLDQLNVDIRSKLAKFDVENNGKLSNENLLHACITLQKQSDNYKRILWYLLFPLLLVALASILGVSILANNITKDSFVRNSELTDSSGRTLVTGYSQEYASYKEWILQNDFSKFDKIDLNGNGFLRVNSAYYSFFNNTLLLDTNYFLISFNKINSKFSVNPKTLFDSGSLTDTMYNIVNEFFAELNYDFELETILQVQSTAKVVRPRGGVSVKCRPSGLCLR
jgi:hypothetical protein